ncbi:sensor histidine kinase [Pseudomonas sp. OIL-1]|uniref:sensor histidine kinase n=1 Tax=Pseudomonas sp. OIL-1 TaxID=2706126 RepID=UPI0013A71CBF|nr:sensor histidine kinase [Pseudomonas sp. OIL-1]QIB51786.1 sensor histidine kinase [Pseudomonas sp. OIL-1]
MRLHRFISSNMEAILKEWEDFAREIQPTGGNLDVTDLRDHAQNMLEVIVLDMATEQTESQQTTKSQGNSPKTGRDTAAEDHANERLSAGFSIRLLVAEYRALRASVLRLWLRDIATGMHEDEHHVDDMIRFNEAIDQALAESVARYSEVVTENSNIFVGMLSHDLRSPLQVMQFGAAKLKKLEEAAETPSRLAPVMISSIYRMKEMLDNLMDFTESRLGTGLKISFGPADLAATSHQLVEEFRSVHQDHSFLHRVSGDCTGTWDALRVAQICQNLISNALQHGDANGEIEVACEGSDDKVILTVKNDGKPIPTSDQNAIFEISTRKHYAQGNPNRNLGLGLYIVKELVTAHNGSVHVTSSQSAGTIFSVVLPRNPSDRSERR